MYYIFVIHVYDLAILQRTSDAYVHMKKAMATKEVHFTE